MPSNSHSGLGNLTGMREITFDTPIKSKKPKLPKDRIMGISEFTYRRMAGFSRQNFNVASYDELLNVLLDSYQQQKSNGSEYSHLTRY
jgi:hypothetical protein